MIDRLANAFFPVGKRGKVEYYTDYAVLRRNILTGEVTGWNPVNATATFAADEASRKNGTAAAVVQEYVTRMYRYHELYTGILERKDDPLVQPLLEANAIVTRERFRERYISDSSFRAQVSDALQRLRQGMREGNWWTPENEFQRLADRFRLLDAAAPNSKPLAGSKSGQGRRRGRSSASDKPDIHPEPKEAKEAVEEATKQLQRRAMEAAAHPPASDDRRTDARLIIPENCTLELIAWDKRDTKKLAPPLVLHVRGGTIELDEGPKEIHPAKENLTFKTQAQYQIRKLRATVRDNVITGTDEYTILPYQVWGYTGNTIQNNRGKLVFQREETEETRCEFRYELCADGTMSWSSVVKGTTRVRFLFGSTSDGKTELTRDFADTMSGGGVWQFRK